MAVDLHDNESLPTVHYSPQGGVKGWEVLLLDLLFSYYRLFILSAYPNVASESRFYVSTSLGDLYYAY